MTKFGYSLYSEGNDPTSLIEQAIEAEKAGFDFLVISDHFSPWLSDQSHAAFAWSVLGAVAQATKNIELATMVTCPIMRYHPVIVAQMAATMGVISRGRFTLGLGAGERLNEHVVGTGWPGAEERHFMLSEAVDIIQALWSGKPVTYYGAFFNVEDAVIFDLPDDPMDMFLAAGGKQAGRLAADKAAGICITEPKKDIIETYKTNGGDVTAMWGQIVTAWAPETKQGLEAAYRQFRFSVGGWKVQAELPNQASFDAATKHVKPADLAESIPAGSDPEVHASAIKKYTEIGISRLALAYPGEDFTGFFHFWQHELKPTLVA